MENILKMVNLEYNKKQIKIANFENTINELNNSLYILQNELAELSEITYRINIDDVKDDLKVVFDDLKIDYDYSDYMNVFEYLEKLTSIGLIRNKETYDFYVTNIISSMYDI